MAGVTDDPAVIRSATPSDGDGHRPPATAPQPASTPEDRTVRARLAATSSDGTDVPRRIGRATGEPGVSTQRHPVVDGAPVEVDVHALGGGRYVLRDGDDRSIVVLGEPVAGRDRTVSQEVLTDGFRFDVELQPERLAALRERATRAGASAGRGGPLEVRAIIPGKVVSVSVVPGDSVVAGQQLLVIEAMKMQNELRAPRDGTIERVDIGPGVNIEVGDLLVVIS